MCLLIIYCSWLRLPVRWFKVEASWNWLYFSDIIFFSFWSTKCSDWGGTRDKPVKVKLCHYIHSNGVKWRSTCRSFCFMDRSYLGDVQVGMASSETIGFIPRLSWKYQNSTDDGKPPPHVSISRLRSSWLLPDLEAQRNNMDVRFSNYYWIRHLYICCHLRSQWNLPISACVCGDTLLNALRQSI